ncbi:MAG: carboxypeptidase regulatory-like domain-containing protein, partial [Longimicrobiales bacterium]
MSRPPGAAETMFAFLRSHLIGAAVLTLSATHHSWALAQSLRGRVHELGTRTPIAVVDLTVLDDEDRELARTQSDSLGDFVLRWKGTERVRLRAQRIGFQSSTSTAIGVRQDEVVTVRMFMSTVPVAVEPLVVASRNRAGDLMGNFADVDRRRKSGTGHFLTRAQIRESGASQISDVLRRVPGVVLQPERNNPNSVSAYSSLNLGTSLSALRRGRSSSATSTGACPMMIFLDGRIHRYPIAGVNVLPPSEIESIEVYRGLSEVPAEFAGEHARCGVIAIWTTRS